MLFCPYKISNSDDFVEFLHLDGSECVCYIGAPRLKFLSTDDHTIHFSIELNLDTPHQVFNSEVGKHFHLVRLSIFKVFNEYPHFCSRTSRHYDDLLSFPHSQVAELGEFVSLLELVFVWDPFAGLNHHFLNVYTQLSFAHVYEVLHCVVRLKVHIVLFAV